MTEREPFTAPGGTLFLVGKLDVLLTTLDGGEATVPLSDFVALFDFLQAAPLSFDQVPETTPQLPLFKDDDLIARTGGEVEAPSSPRPPGQSSEPT